MRFWLSKNSDVPIREQLASQIIFGITSADLKPGQRLPSTRELARRFRIHANTVIATYRDLEERGWIELRQGSGAYVRAKKATSDTAEDGKLALDQLTMTFLQQARNGGHSIQDIKASVQYWLDLQPPDHILVIDPDTALCEILMAEIAEATGWRVAGTGVEECNAKKLAGAQPVALYSRADAVRAVLPVNTHCHLLHLNSVMAAVQGREKPPPEALIAVVSGWADFLRWSHAMLIAVGIEEAALNLRLTSEAGWQRGLHSSAFVIADMLTAKQLPSHLETRVFRLIADSSLTE
ncbi:MAG TPA: GntR family transcriptional regulator, partial [Blastocatellia bacterium]|nr:GntR family transcriptional regulator [Blastocatellia bacterium]